MNTTILRQAYRIPRNTLTYEATRADGSRICLFIGPCGADVRTYARGYVLTSGGIIVDRLRNTRDPRAVLAWWRFHNAIAYSTRRTARAAEPFPQRPWTAADQSALAL